MRPDILPDPNRDLTDDDKKALGVVEALLQRIKDTSYQCGNTRFEDLDSENYAALCNEAQARVDEMVSLVRGILLQKTRNHGAAEDIIRARESKILGLFDRIDRLSTALRDAISTYDPSKEVVLVTEERQEAWIKALNY